MDISKCLNFFIHKWPFNYQVFRVEDRELVQQESRVMYEVRPHNVYSIIVD